MHLLPKALIIGIMSAIPMASANAEYPTRPISMIVGYPAGGYVDAVARIVAAKMSDDLGQQVVIINRAGAGGNIGVQALLRSDPNGYTIMIHGVSSMATHSVLFSEDERSQLPEMEVAAVVASTPGVITVPQSLGVKDFKSFVELVRKEHGKHNYGTPGIGTPSYFWSIELIRSEKLEVSHVPFKGGAAAMQELMAGRISWTFDTPIGSVPAIQTGKAVPIAVVSPKRIAVLKDVPTIAEVGLPHLADKVSTLFILAPAKTDKTTIQRLNAAFHKVMLDRQFIDRMESSGSFFPIGPHTPEQSQKLAITDYESWFRMAKDAKDTPKTP